MAHAAVPAETATIQGKIDNLLGDDLDGVTVVAFNPDDGGEFTSTTTNEGEFRIKDLDPGHYVVRFYHPLYLSEIVFASVGPGDVFQLQESLTPITGELFAYDLTGKITDVDSTAAIPGAMVFLIDDNGNDESSYFDTTVPHQYVTDSDGNGDYRFVDLANGSYKLKVQADGYLTAMTDIVINGTTKVNQTLALAEDHGDRYKVYPKDDSGKDIDLDKVRVTMYDRDTQTWVEGENNVLSYNFYPAAGEHVFIAMPSEVGTYNGGLEQASVSGADLNFQISLADWELMDQQHDLTFTDWETLEWTLETTHATTGGRMVGMDADAMFYQPLTGHLYFDIDHLWGDDDGTADYNEIVQYLAWENDLDVAQHDTDGFVRYSDDNAFTYQEGSYAFDLLKTDGTRLPSTSITSTANFITSVSATYTTTVEDLDEYKILLWAANSEPATYAYSYHLDWPANFETTKNSTGNKLEAEVTGTPDSDVITGDHVDDKTGGNVTFTVTRNILPVPIIKLTNGIKAISINDADGKLVELYTVNSSTQVNFSAEDSTDSVGLTAYDWLLPGPVALSGLEVNRTFGANDGNVTVKLTVTDTAGATNSTELIIYIDDTKPILEFNMTVKQTHGAEGELYTLLDETNNTSNLDEDNDIVVFDASNSTDPFLGHNGIVSYQWSFSDNWTDDGVIISRTFNDPGRYTATLTVTDAAGNSNLLSRDLYVNDVTEPEVTFNWYSWNETGALVNQAGTIGQTIQFNATKTTDNAQGPLTYDWLFGDGPDDANITWEEVDGSAGKLMNVTFHKHKGDGYPVVLTVTDLAGNQGVYSRTVTPVKQLRPDLVAVSIVKASAGEAQAGDRVVFKVTIGLVGMNIDQDIHVSVYKGEIGPNNQIGENLTLTPADFDFKEGQENSVVRNITWNKAQEFEGNFYLFVDSGNVINEGDDEKNNVNQFFMPVQPTTSNSDNTWLIALLVILIVGGVAVYYFLYMRPSVGDDY